jgi:hypothetical protein
MGNGTLFGIVDCARDDRLYDLVMGCPNWSCLFAGKLPDELARTAPYLVALDEPSPLSRAWGLQGMGQSWGIKCRSSLTMPALRRHFRRFIQAKLPDGDVVLFRFYDPRVWVPFWESCTPEERGVWLEGVESFDTAGL